LYDKILPFRIGTGDFPGRRVYGNCALREGDVSGISGTNYRSAGGLEKDIGGTGIGECKSKVADAGRCEDESQRLSILN
jgi:hypothetical protein